MLKCEFQVRATVSANPETELTEGRGPSKVSCRTLATVDPSPDTSHTKPTLSIGHRIC